MFDDRDVPRRDNFTETSGRRLLDYLVIVSNLTPDFTDDSDLTVPIEKACSP